jgi:hypothetical protein
MAETPMDIAKNVAKEISTELSENHISTLAYDLPTIEEFSEGKSSIPLFVVVSKFNSAVALKLADISQKWSNLGIEGPFIAEMSDLQGMEDSVPDELWNVAKNYTVLEGSDVLNDLPQFNKEYLRAQAELTIRRYIFTLRWTLPQVLHNDFQLKCYMNNLAFYSQLSIQLYHRIVYPDIRIPEEHLSKFYEEHPDSKQYLDTLLNHIYENKPLDEKPVDILTNTIDTVLQVILRKIDMLGKTTEQTTTQQPPPQQQPPQAAPTAAPAPAPTPTPAPTTPPTQPQQ